MIMTKIRITPFFILNPLIAIWAIYSLLMLHGFASIISGFFITIIIASIVLFIIDRMFMRQVKLWIVYLAEILILLFSFELADWYLYS